MTIKASSTGNSPVVKYWTDSEYFSLVYMMSVHVQPDEEIFLGLLGLFGGRIYNRTDDELNVGFEDYQDGVDFCSRNDEMVSKPISRNISVVLNNDPPTATYKLEISNSSSPTPQTFEVTVT